MWKHFFPFFLSLVTKKFEEILQLFYMLMLSDKTLEQKEIVKKNI